MKVIQAKLPDHLYTEAIFLVKEEGWFRDEQEIFFESIRRYLDAHRPELMEQFIREDIKWGLPGDE